MVYHCRKACETCISLHVGETQKAPANSSSLDAFVNKLMETQQYVYDEASLSPSVLKTCTNQHELCTMWSINGECESNSDFMHKDCAAACQTCKRQ